jgi:tetratricopeptide (TPR) repeat protein
MMVSGRSHALARLVASLALLVTSIAAPVEDPRVQSLAAQAGKAFSSGNLPLAEELYGQALSLSPSSSRLLVNLAAVKTRRGKSAESVELARKALSYDWQNSQAWLLLGMNALESGKNDEAIADLMQATFRDENNPRAHNYLGIAAGRKGWNEVSEKELRKAVELDPDYADANFNLAVFYLGRTPPLIEMVRRHYQRALDLGCPHDAALEARLAKAVASPASSPSSSAALP